MADVETTLTPGITRILEADFSNAASTFGSSVVSIVWSIETGDFVTLGTQVNNYGSSKSAVPLSSDGSIGTAVIKALATFADSQTAIIWFDLTYSSSQSLATSTVTLTVEDGTGTVVSANTYLSLASFKAFCIQKNLQIGTYSDSDIARALIEGSSYADLKWEMRLKGSILLDTQPLAFPRYQLYDINSVLVEGLPTRWVTAVSWYSYYSLLGILYPQTQLTAKEVKRKKVTVGPITTETEYQGVSSSTALLSFPIPDKLVSYYLRPGSNGGVIR